MPYFRAGDEGAGPRNRLKSERPRLKLVLAQRRAHALQERIEAGGHHHRAGEDAPVALDQRLDLAALMDDGAVGKAICLNLADTKGRNACLSDRDASQTEATALCEGQHDTRLAACGVLGENRYDPDIRPALFDSPRRPSHPNPYFPQRVGLHWEYRTGTLFNTVDVVNATKQIAGVNCAVFHDQTSEGGES